MIKLFLSWWKSNGKRLNSEKEAKRISDEKFISDNYPDLILLPDGLRYKTVIKGSGNPPSEGTEIKLSYTGRLINGLKFASSAAKGQPVASSVPAAFSYTAWQ